MLIKVLFHLGVVELLVKIVLGRLLDFVSKEVGMIVSSGGLILEITDHRF